MRKIRKNIVILFILNLIVFGLYYYLLMDTKRIDVDTSSKLNQINLDALKREQLQSVKNLLDETKTQRNKISNLFIQADGSVEFIEMIESLSKTASTKLIIESVGIDTQKTKIGSSTESIRLALKTEGLWINVVHFLNILENLPFKISFDTVVLDRNSEVLSSTSSKTKEKSPSYWKGSFSFSVLKIKNVSQILQKQNEKF